MEASTATLYRASVSFGTQETQLVWTRYTAFVVMNGFLVNAVVNAVLVHNAPTIQAWTLSCVGVIGLFINSVWHMLNFFGWQNQNRWYNVASHILDSSWKEEAKDDSGEPPASDPPRNAESKQKFRLPTDWYSDFRQPFGVIYRLGQVIPIGFAGASVVCLQAGVYKQYSWILVVVIVIITVCLERGVGQEPNALA